MQIIKYWNKNKKLNNDLRKALANIKYEFYKDYTRETIILLIPKIKEKKLVKLITDYVDKMTMNRIYETNILDEVVINGTPLIEKM